LAAKRPTTFDLFATPGKAPLGADPAIEDAYGNAALDLALSSEVENPVGRGAGDEPSLLGPTAVEVLRDASRQQ